MDYQLYLLPMGVFVIVAATVYVLTAVLDPYRLRVRSRLQQFEQQGASSVGLSDGRTAAAVADSPIVAWLRGWLPQHEEGRTQLQRRFARAGIYRADAASKYCFWRLVLVTFVVAAVVGVGYAGFLRMETALLWACLLAVLASMAPSFWLDRQIAKYHLLLAKSLPDFLDLMTVCLEGGMSLQETIRRVADELRLAHPALTTELAMVQRDVELGATVDQALRRFATRTDYEGVRILSAFIREAQRFGTNITEALRSHADMLRSQREQAAEEKAQKAAVKILLPTLLLIFPATFVVAVGPAIIQIQEAFAAK